MAAESHDLSLAPRRNCLRRDDVCSFQERVLGGLPDDESEPAVKVCREKIHRRHPVWSLVYAASVGGESVSQEPQGKGSLIARPRTRDVIRMTMVMIPAPLLMCKKSLGMRREQAANLQCHVPLSVLNALEHIRKWDLRKQKAVR